MTGRSFVRYRAQTTGLALVFLAALAGIGAGQARARSGPSPDSQPAQRQGISRFITGKQRPSALQSLKLDEIEVGRQSSKPPTTDLWRDARDRAAAQRRPFLRADPRQWPRLFPNTTECTLSFDPITRRHWWE